MRISHFTPSYTPINPRLTAQTHRDHETMSGLGFDYRWYSENCSDICVVRNRAVRQAMEWGCDYLCMQDSDIYSTFSIGAVAPLLETATATGAAMVAAICGLRREPHTANVEPCKAGEVYEATKAGTGLVLIDVKQVALLWGEVQLFDKTYADNGCAIDVGEDIWFCRVLREAELTIWVDGRVPTTHINEDHFTLAYPGAATVSSNPRTTGTQPQTGAR